MNNILKKSYIGDICDINLSTYSQSENWKFVNYLDTGNITKNKIENIQYIDLNLDKLPSRARRKVKVNNIIYSTVRPNQMHYGILTQDIPENFLVSTGFAVLDVDSTQAAPYFVYYSLIQNNNTTALQAIAEQSTSAYPSIKPSDIKNREILLPPLETQQKIAKILSEIDDKIELNNSINNNLEQQAMALFKSWFIDFEPFNGIIPDDWLEDILGNFIEIKRGGSPRPIQDYIADSGYRWLKISDATSIQSPFILNIKEHIKESGINKTVLLKSGSLVLSNSATPGIPKILDVDSCIHDGWLYFPKSMLSNEYLYLLFKFIRPNLVALGNGSVFTNLKTDILRNYNTILPDKETLTKFDGVVSAIFKQILYNTRENEKLIQLRDTLLPKLMSGEIDVSNVEIDDILENQSADKLSFSEDK